MVEQMTQAYRDKVRATQLMRDPNRAKPDDTPLQVENLKLHYHAPSKKKPKQVSCAEKPLISLKTLVPEQLADKIEVEDTTF